MTAKVISLSKTKSGIRPVEFKVVVKPDEMEEKTAGGIIIPDEKRDRDQMAMHTGTIIESSPHAFTWEADGTKGELAPRTGDRVIYAKYAGSIVHGNDGEEYRVMNDKDICAVLEDV